MPKKQKKLNEWGKSDIFSLTHVADLPREISSKVNIQRNSIRENTQKVLDLFLIKKKLSISEIMVALYRVYNLEKSRGWIATTLYNLAQKKYLKKLDIGIYEDVRLHLK